MYPIDSQKENEGDKDKEKRQNKMMMEMQRKKKRFVCTDVIHGNVLFFKISYELGFVFSE